MKINRRNFIIKLFFGLISAVWLNGYWFEKYKVQWKTFDLLGSGHDGIKTIQLSDLHLKTIKSFHRSLAHRVNTEKPDVLFFTGDAISYDYQLAVFDQFLGFIDSDIPKIAILGNTEYKGVKIGKLKSLYKKHNGHLLINERFYLKIRNRTINIIGIDDLYGGNADFSIPARISEPSIDSVVLVHRPVYREEIDSINTRFKLPIKMILSGHTHGGQIALFGKVFFTPEGSGDYVKGWYENKHSKMFVSKGIGTSLLPIRFGARAEATIFYV